MKRVILFIVTIMIVTSTFSLISVHTAFARSAKTALAAPVCHYDNSCTGLDPNSTAAPNGYVCSHDEFPLERVKIPDGWVDLEGSVNCGTNWSVTELDTNLIYTRSYIMNANVTRAGGGPNSHFDGTSYNMLEVHSPMIFSPTTPAQACGSIDNLPGGCTVWF